MIDLIKDSSLNQDKMLSSSHSPIKSVYKCKLLFLFINFRQILFVDDEVFNHDVFKLMCEELGDINCKFCYDGEDAFNLICQKVKNKEYCSQNCSLFRAIFTDFNMGRMHGDVLTKLIRKFYNENYLETIKIFAITAYNTEKDKNILIKAGVNKVFSKPL